VESVFGRSLQERAAEIQNRRAWKTQGSGAQFMDLNRGIRPAPDADDFAILLTSVARGSAPGEILYSLETVDISGVFAVDSNGLERRLFHTADFRVRDLAVRPDGTAIAASVTHGSMAANIATLNGNGSDLREVSDGDSVDLAPHWEPGERHRLVFQSAGLGRDASGRLSERGPFAVQRLDLESGELECLADESDCDLLGPQVAPDGSLYYVRRPFAHKRAAAHPLDALKDALLFPFQVALGFLTFVSLFGIIAGAKRPEWTGLGKRDRAVQQVNLWGEMMPVCCATPEKRHDEADAPSLVPSSWQLVRQSSAGKEVLANGILSFDIAPDGCLLYSNGRTVHSIDPAGPSVQRIFHGDMIQQVAAL
jgi:hypothetical protein